ncbi:unnamed protein product [Linum trigynum]|uniref:Protein Abitram n=1 Tax=Linum trigynum TaxID=586398 RepID=A0AAV2EDF0_9ROSI
MADYTVHESNDPEKQGKPEFLLPVEDDEERRKLLVPDPGNPRRQSSFRRRNQLRLLFRSRFCEARARRHANGLCVTGKRKKNAQHFESNTAMCKVSTKGDSYIVMCCVKGSLLEVNDRLTKQPGLLNTSADREGYVAIIMPMPADWLKV